MAPWLREVVQLIHAGDREKAIAQTRARAEAGDIAAKVRLAVFGSDAGLSHDEACRVVDKAEAAHSPDDATAHWVLRGAYEVGLGTCEYEEKSRRVLAHLEAYARLTNSASATYAVAVIYGQGNIGTPASPTKAREWLKRLAELDRVEARRALDSSGRDA